MSKSLLLAWALALCGCGPSASKLSRQSAVLTTPEGRQFVGDQLQFFEVDRDGTISPARNSWLSLYYTEGKPFRLTGEVWLGPPIIPIGFQEDFPDGFALFIREWDSLHRYSFTTRDITAKRRKLSGRQERNITTLATFEALPQNQWIPFSLEAAPEEISFQIGRQSGKVPGPLDMDGANKIVVAPSCKIRSLRLEILQSK